MRTSFLSHSEAETVSIAASLASRLAPGSVVLLCGELGAGKTAFVRGLVRGVEGDPDQVTSPTFTLVQEYRGRVTLYHVDLYRLQGREADDLGLEEMTAGHAIVAIEWADKLPRPIEGAVQVSIKDKGGDDREITIAGAEISAARSWSFV